MWPLSSPDLNVLDCYWWSIVENRSNRTPHTNLDSLKSAIIRAWESVPLEEIVRACAAFRPRLEAIIKAEGGHIE